METAFTLKLPVVLSQSDLAMRSTELGDALQERAQVEFDRKQAANGYSRQIKAIDRKIGELGQVVRTGEESRLVECTERANFGDRTVETYRLDTQDRVSARPIRKDEAQMDFFASSISKPRAERAGGPGDEEDGDDDDDADGPSPGRRSAHTELTE